MTVELLVALPVALVIALVAVNALSFFGECAAFDRAGRELVRVAAASPGYGQSQAGSAALVQAALAERFDAENLECEAAVEQDALSHARFTLTLRYRPTLFGLGLRDSVLGVALPRLEHRKQMTIDTYKPGMLF